MALPVPTSAAKPRRGREHSVAIRRRRDRRWRGRRRSRQRRRRWRRYRAGAPDGGAASAESGQDWRGRRWRRGAVGIVGRPGVRLRRVVNRSAAASGVACAVHSRPQTWPAARRGAPAGRCRAPPGWRRARLRSGWWISAGLFAISVVASLLRRTIEARPVTLDGSRLRARKSQGPRVPANHAFISAPAILSAWHYERNREIKDFFIIVNLLLTMTFAAPECRRITAAHWLRRRKPGLWRTAHLPRFGPAQVTVRGDTEWARRVTLGRSHGATRDQDRRPGTGRSQPRQRSTAASSRA